MNTVTKDLAYYLAQEYPYTVVPDEDEWFVSYPDLPGCMTVVEDAVDIPAMAQEIKELWLKTAFEDGFTIPEPVSTEYSGKFVVRLPKSLHQTLAHRAEKEGTSLNSYVVHLLGERCAATAMQQVLLDRLDTLSTQVTTMAASQKYSVELEPSDREAISNRVPELHLVYSAVAV